MIAGKGNSRFVASNNRFDPVVAESRPVQHETYVPRGCAVVTGPRPEGYGIRDDQAQADDGDQAHPTPNGEGVTRGWTDTNRHG